MRERRHAQRVRPPRAQPPPPLPPVLRLGGTPPTARDLYHALLTMRWHWFFVALAAAYFMFNSAFALLYLAAPGDIANAQEGSFADAFFFSVQTMATIGFGVMAPKTLYANIIVTIEALMGLAGFALATGVIFQRFSRPTARVLFSRVAVVTRFEGVPTLMFRCANERRNIMLEAEVHVYLAREEASAEGMQFRRTHDLKLARSRNPLFSLSWTVMHPIDAKSPLHGADAAALAAQESAIVVTLTGTDESLSQTILARHVYDAADILWGRRFADVLSRTDGGLRVIDYRRFHDTESDGG
ncbi:MAG TPA: ion channel [Stellaceae bacterium]|nr:ion channel [Stellaceae bacterium]